jgi:hypothetical protein
MLEYVYQLEKRRDGDYEKMMSELCLKNLLFIGCPLSNWLGRFLLRISINKRLTEYPGKSEFMVIDPENNDPELISFLERFSKNTRICYMSAGAFVDELTDRWKKHLGYGTEDQFMNAAIFISYANEDNQAAKRIFKRLKDITGKDEVWMDQEGGLKWGDDYKEMIRKAIKAKCYLFIPLVSSNTLKCKIRDRFFRMEWEWAANRDEENTGGKFIFPLIVDDAKEAETDSNRFNKLLRNESAIVQSQFKKAHYVRAINGEISDDILNEIRLEIRKMRERNGL